MNKEKLLFCLIAVFIFGTIVSASLVDDVVTRVNDVICTALCIIWYIIAALAALILILAGAKYMASESPDDRNESRKRIVQAVMGLIIVLIATPLVNYLIQNTEITAFKGCNCVFPPIDEKPTTTPRWTVTTVTQGGVTITTTHGLTATTKKPTTTTSSGGTTTTSTVGVSCNEECINSGYSRGKCKDICDSDEIDYGTADDCSPIDTCCCIPFPTTTTTKTTTTTTTTTTSTTTTTTTVPCAKPGKCSTPAVSCLQAEILGKCWETGDGLSLENECGTDYVECCCQYYPPNCCP